MKTIVNAKISRFELASILFAAKWQMQDWKKNASDAGKDTWDEPLKAIKYMENFMKDYPNSFYLIRMDETEV